MANDFTTVDEKDETSGDDGDRATANSIGLSDLVKDSVD